MKIFTRKNKQPKAIIFVEYRYKNESIIEAKKAGFKTILITKNTPSNISTNLFDKIITKDISNTEDLNKLIEYLKRNYLIKNIVSNYEHYVVLRSYLGEKLNIPSCSLYGACCSRNKAMLREALKSIPENIEYNLVETEKQAIQAFKNLGKDVFIKSISGIKSRFVFRVKNKDEIKTIFKKINNIKTSKDNQLYEDYQNFNFDFKYPDPKKTFLVEKTTPGQQITVASLIGKNNIWHAPSICDVYTARDIGRNDSFLAYRIIPSNHSPQTIKKVKTVVATAIKTLDLQYCSTHSELIIDNNGDIKIIEIASRMGGYRAKMYQESFKINLNKLFIQSIIGKKIRTKSKPKKHVSILEIFPEQQGNLIKIRNLRELQNDENIKNLSIKAKPNDEVGLAKDGYKPVLSFMITGNSYEEVKDKSDYYHQKLIVETDSLNS